MFYKSLGVYTSNPFCLYWKNNLKGERSPSFKKCAYVRKTKTKWQQGVLIKLFTHFTIPKEENCDLCIVRKKKSKTGLLTLFFIAVVVVADMG